MHVVIENAWWLWGAVGVAALVGWMMYLARGRSLRWRAACVALPGAAAVMVALAAAGIALEWQPIAKHVVMLLDLSGSTRGCPWRGAGGGNWVRGLAELRLGPDKEVTVVGFGGRGGVKVLLDGVKPGDVGRWPSEWNWDDAGVGSDLGAALAWRSDGELRGGAILPRWVVTDGLISPSKAEGLQSLGLMGVTEIPAREVDVGVLELGGRKARDGVDVWARVRATGRADARLTVLRDGTAVVSGQRLSFEGDASRWVNVHDAAAGSDPHRYEVRAVREPRADPWPENDVGSFLWRPEEGKARVLVVGDGAIIRGSDFRRGIVIPDAFPANAGDLLAAGWQVIVLNDVAAGELPARSGEVLEEFVRETGGGLVMVGKKKAFGPGGYAEELGGKLEELSAVWSSPRDRPPARVVFVVDASGSMNEVAIGQSERKFPLVARGVEGAMGLLQDQDLVTVVTFSDHADPLAAGRKEELVEGPDVLRQALDKVKPTGETVPDSALELVSGALGDAAARPKDAPPPMVVLLTDGEIPAMDIAKWQDALQKAGAKMTIVAPPPESQESVLAKLAKETGATWLNGADAGAWAKLLKRAVAEQLMGRAMTTDLRWQSDDGKLKGTTREWIEVWKKGEAREVARSDSTPVRTMAAVAQRGLGKVAAVAMGGETADELVGRLVKDVMPAAGDRRFTVSAQRAEDGWAIGADGVEAGKFLDGEKLRLRIVGRGVERIVDMPQTAAGHYEVRVQGGEEFAGVVVRNAKEGEQLVGRVLPAKTEIGEWPASVENKVEFPPPTEKISADDMDKRQWEPRVAQWRLFLSRWLWVLAAAMGTLSLLVRRGPMGRTTTR